MKLGNSKEEGYVRLTHAPGTAQADFGSVDFYDNGVLRDAKYFVLSFPQSNAGYLQLTYGENIVFPAGVSVDSLLELDFMHQGKNVIMYGGSGTGKTMLSILIGMSACSKGIPVRFCRTAGLVNRFAEHKANLTQLLSRRSLKKRTFSFLMSLATFLMTIPAHSCFLTLCQRFMNISQ